jgi:hypothetical protein
MSDLGARTLLARHVEAEQHRRAADFRVMDRAAPRFSASSPSDRDPLPRSICRSTTWALPDSRSDQNFTASCDEVFRRTELEIIRTPFAAAGERRGRAVRAHRSVSVSRLAPDPE